MACVGNITQALAQLAALPALQDLDLSRNSLQWNGDREPREPGRRPADGAGGHDASAGMTRKCRTALTALNLHSLDLSHNPFFPTDMIPGSGNLPKSLQKLCLEGCKLNELPTSLVSLSRLTSLNLASNWLIELPLGALPERYPYPIEWYPMDAISSAG